MSDLRALAEAALKADRANAERWTSADVRDAGRALDAFHAAASPDRILALLDVVDAARERDLSGYPELRDALAAWDALT